MSQRQDSDISAILRWLDVGANVLVSGSEGSGRTTTLKLLAANLTAAEVHVLQVSALHSGSSSSLNALLLHPLAPAMRPGASAPQLAQAFIEELRGSRNVLILDDLLYLDPASVAVIESVLLATGAQFVTSSPVDRSVIENSAAKQLLALTPMAEVRLDPLEFLELAEALRDHLGGPADGSLTTELLTRSAGIPSVALALADSAVWARSVQRIDGVWTVTGSLNKIPHDAVVNLLASRLDQNELAGLQTLAWMGALPIDQVRDLIGESGLDKLRRRNRISVNRIEEGEFITISPPALARGLIERLEGVGRVSMASGLHPSISRQPAEIQQHSEQLLERVFLARPDTRAEYLSWSSDITSLIREVTQKETDRNLDAWRRTRNLAQALVYLSSPMLSIDPETIEEVLAAVPDRAPDEFGEREAWSRLAINKAQWMTWRDSDDAGATRYLTGVGEQLEGVLKTRVLTFLTFMNFGSEGLPNPMTTIDALKVDSDDILTRAYSVFLRAGVLLELCRPQEALDLLDQEPVLVESNRWSALGSSIKADTLLALGRVEDAIEYSRALLAEAYSNLDLDGIRAHSRALGMALIIQGEIPGAWRVLGTALRLGLPGPLVVGFSARILVPAVIALASLDRVDEARVLFREMQTPEATFFTPISGVAAVASARLYRADGQPERAEKVLRDHMKLARERGFVMSSIVCGLMRHTIESPAELAWARKALSSAPESILTKAVELHEAVAMRDESRLMRLVKTVPPVFVSPIGPQIVEALNLARTRRGEGHLSKAELHQVLPSTVNLGLRANPDVGDREGLSERERQVAMLARSGLSNRDIAQQLVISVRTVENHMYRVLRKLGLESREELSSRWHPLGGN